MIDENETTRPTGGFMARMRRIVVVAVVLALAGATLYLLAERNSRYYFLASEGDQLVVARGARLPWGKRSWAPQDPGQAAAYGAIRLPDGVAAVAEQRFDERQDLDRALFELLAGWADARIRTDEPAQMREGMLYVERAGILPGISTEQQKRLRGLRAELAYYEGRDRLEEGGKLLRGAREQLRLATEASAGRAREAVAILDDLDPALDLVERALQTARGLRGPGAEVASPAPTGGKPATPARARDEGATGPAALGGNAGEPQVEDEAEAAGGAPGLEPAKEQVEQQAKERKAGQEQGDAAAAPGKL